MSNQTEKEERIIENAESEKNISEKNSEEKVKKTSNFKYFVNFIYTFIITILIIVAVAFAACKILDINAFSVESGSMSPAYPVDSAVFVKSVEPETIKVGDVITYVLNEQGTLVTHRVTEIDQVDRTFITKGDANNSQDPSPVRWENTVGKVVFGIPKIGIVLRFFSDETKRPYIIAAVAAIGVISIASDLIERGISKKKAAKSAK